ncbi:hypothetical protein FIBSPDRAFT_970427 [Athelia psychrophila]|uniref:Uncharacterized protein n=1 Tax=Athelia psychrophila TaxID=1759441 RepID=A0A167SPR5_9AGAM|nr:hypothetical protein FIBSPDRAFT_970427 [Fibularhizoctonia sp. CBS 109695]
MDVYEAVFVGRSERTLAYGLFRDIGVYDKSAYAGCEGAGAQLASFIILGIAVRTSVCFSSGGVLFFAAFIVFRYQKGALYHLFIEATALRLVDGRITSREIGTCDSYRRGRKVAAEY